MAHDSVIPTEFVAFADPRRPVMRTIATRKHSPADILAFTQWLPNPDVILKSLGRDISVYRELRAEPAVDSSIRRRKSAVKVLEPELTPRNADATVVDFLREVMKGWDIDRIIASCPIAFFGYQPAELTWVINVTAACRSAILSVNHPSALVLMTATSCAFVPIRPGWPVNYCPRASLW